MESGRKTGRLGGQPALRGKGFFLQGPLVFFKAFGEMKPGAICSEVEQTGPGLRSRPVPPGHRLGPRRRGAGPARPRLNPLGARG